MSFEVVGDVIHVKGHCRVEDAEALVGLLRRHAQVKLDLSACESLHGAVLQAILAFGAPIVGTPTDGFLRDLLVPALAATGKVTL